MANISCTSCEELRQEAPSLIVNGFDDDMCTSLQNDTGLIASSGHDDCEDLNNLNDCLVGNEAEEVDMYDVCDWKTFMKQFIPNLWTTLKAIICAICGLWTNVHNLRERIEYVCSLLNVVINPTAPIFGVFPRNTEAAATRSMGTIVEKNGRPALIDAHLDWHNADLYTVAGLRWGDVDAVNCSTGVKVTKHFFKPIIWGFKINQDVEVGDPLWVVTKSQLQSLTSWSDELWETFKVESWTWTQHRVVSGDDSHKYVWLKLQVGNAGYSDDYLVLTFEGTSYPTGKFDYDALVIEGDIEEIRWS